MGLKHRSWTPKLKFGSLVVGESSCPSGSTGTASTHLEISNKRIGHMSIRYLLVTCKDQTKSFCMVTRLGDEPSSPKRPEDSRESPRIISGHNAKSSPAPSKALWILQLLDAIIGMIPFLPGSLGMRRWSVAKTVGSLVAGVCKLTGCTNPLANSRRIQITMTTNLFLAHCHGGES